MMNFTLMGARDVCLFINLLELRSGMQITYLGTVSYFLVLLLWFVRWACIRA